jgi:ubiquitin C-terminal hydrolase
MGVFQTAILAIPSTESSTRDLGHVFQHIFLDLQRKTASVSIATLPEAYGITQQSASTVHDDASEFLIRLLDKLETDSAVKAVIQKTFAGTMQISIKCINVNFSSTTPEPFLDIPLEVVGFSDIYASLRDKFANKETLSEANLNQYDTATVLGKQDAYKSTMLQHIGPVLILPLKRFQQLPTVHIQDVL